MSYVTLNLYKGTQSEEEKSTHSWEALETKASYPATITNTNCAGVTPNNEAAVKDAHTQDTTDETTLPGYGGHLEDPFQPFGAFELCLLDTGLDRTYKVKYENKALIGGSPSIYLSQRPTAEVVKEREENESAYKAKETAYKAKETAYKAKATAYKTKETEYKTKETAYKTKKTEYETAKSKWESTHNPTYKTEYEHDKTEYEHDKTEYETDKTEYEHDKTEYEHDKPEYETDKTEYEHDKSVYETAHTEEKEGTSVTVEKGTVCS